MMKCESTKAYSQSNHNSIKNSHEVFLKVAQKNPI